MVGCRGRWLISRLKVVIHMVCRALLAQNTLAWHRWLWLLFRRLMENGLTILRNSNASACRSIRVGPNLIPMALVVLALFV